MKKRRHTPEQITRKLREADRLLAEGKTIPEVAKHLDISERRACRITGQSRSTQRRLPLLWHRSSLHRARVSLAKPIRRIPEGPPPGRTAEPGALFHLAGGAGARRRLAG